MQYLVGDEVFAGTVALDYRRHHILRHMLIIGEKLLGVFGEAVAAVAERWVVVVCANTRIETDALDYCLGVESFDLSVCVEFVEIADAQCEVGIGEELYSLGFLHAHI